MPTPLADDVFLLLMHPRRGRGPVWEVEAVHVLLIGATILELLAAGRLHRRQDERWAGVGYLEVVDDRPTGDAELDAALTDLSAKEWSTEDVFGLRRGLRHRVGDRLGRAGCVNRVPGLWSGARYVPVGDEAEVRLRAEVAEAARTGSATSQRAADILFLASTRGLSARVAGLRERDVHLGSLPAGGPFWLRQLLTASAAGGDSGAVT